MGNSETQTGSCDGDMVLTGEDVLDLQDDALLDDLSDNEFIDYYDLLDDA